MNRLHQAKTSLKHRWQLLASGVVLCCLLTAGVACVSGSHAAQTPAAPYPHTLAQVNFAVAGDVIPHETVKDAAKAAGPGADGWAALFSQVADVFEHADFGFLNMETPVAPEHTHGTKPFMFDAPVDLITALKRSGIRIVSFANNHVFDQGQPGFAETREHLREQGMLFAGSGDTVASAWQPVIVEKSGIKVGILGMTRWLNGNRNPESDAEPHVNFFPYPDDNAGGAPGMDAAGVLEAVKQARAKCDFLVVSIHWGVEYAPAPRLVDVEMAHKMLDAGATVIVGHHPHVLQPVESYRTQDGRDGLIFFSLGNFLSNQSREYRLGMADKEGEPRDELIGEFSVVRKDYGPAGVKVELANVGILPVWGENNHNELGSTAKIPVIRPVLMDREIPALETRIAELNNAANTPAAEITAAQKQELTTDNARLKLLEDRRRLLLARTGNTFLTAPPVVAK
jgi:poly-gamma-glutamate capsule biosynthesis protein CapA/YwtB (metallophosphatase superfamily)